MTIKRYLIKITSVILTVSFLCMDIMAYAGEEISIRSGSSNLAPRLRVTDPDFQEIFRVGGFLLKDKDAAEYIYKQIEQEQGVFTDWKSRRTELVDPYAPEYQGNITMRVRGLDSVVFIKVAGLVNSTGQFARVELSNRFNGGGPVFFIDSMHCNTPDLCVQKHEMDEIKQWENLRVNILHIGDKTKMQSWITEHLNSPDERLKGAKYKGKTSLQIARIFHNNSYSLKTLYKKSAGKIDFDGEILNPLIAFYGARYVSDDGNISAGGSGEKPSSASGAGKAEPKSTGAIAKANKAIDSLLRLFPGKTILQILPLLVKDENWVAVQVAVEKIRADGVEKLGAENLTYLKEVESRLGRESDTVILLLNSSKEAPAQRRRPADYYDYTKHPISPQISLRQMFRKGAFQTITAPKIIRWFETGEGLNAGDYFITAVNLGGEKRFFDKRGKYKQFVFRIPGKKGEIIEVLFLVRKDKNHGAVLNCYYFEDDKQFNELTLFATFKYIPALKKVVKFDLAAADIVYTAYHFHEIRSLARPFWATITKYGHVWVGTHKTEDSLFHAFALKIPEKIFRRKNLAHKPVVAAVEEDKNHGQVINIYLASDYDANKRDGPIATYRHYPELESRPPEFRKIIAQNLAVLDIIAAFEGKTLEVLGREARVRIRKCRGEDQAEAGVCGVSYQVTPSHRRRAEFAVPRQYVGQYAVIKAEKDINQGQVINIYLEPDLKDARQQPKPIATYKYFSGVHSYHKKAKIGMCRQVDLAALDIQDYYRGRTDLKPQEGRTTDLKVNYAPRKNAPVSFRAFTKTTRPFSKLIVFVLSPIAREVFLPWRAPQTVSAALKEDPDYGLYIEITRNDVVLARYYYLREIKRCSPIDFNRMAFFDWVFGDKNIHGKEIQPRPHKLYPKVSDRRRMHLRYLNRVLDIAGLRLLKGKNAVLIIVPDVKYGWVAHLHDVNKYKKDQARNPDIILMRDAARKDLTPLPEFATYRQRRKAAVSNGDEREAPDSAPGSGAHMAKEPASRPEGEPSGQVPQQPYRRTLRRGDTIQIGGVVITVKSVGNVISRVTRKDCRLCVFDVLVPPYRHLVRHEVDDGTIAKGMDREALIPVYRYTDQDSSSRFRIDKIRIRILPGSGRRDIILEITNPDDEPISVVRINKNSTGDVSDARPGPNRRNFILGVISAGAGILAAAKTAKGGEAPLGVMVDKGLENKALLKISDKTAGRASEVKGAIVEALKGLLKANEHLRFEKIENKGIIIETTNKKGVLRVTINETKVVYKAKPPFKKITLINLESPTLADDIAKLQKNIYGKDFAKAEKEREETLDTAVTIYKAVLYGVPIVATIIALIFGIRRFLTGSGNKKEEGDEEERPKRRGKSLYLGQRPGTGAWSVDSSSGGWPRKTGRRNPPPSSPPGMIGLAWKHVVPYLQNKGWKDKNIAFWCGFAEEAVIAAAIGIGLCFFGCDVKSLYIWGLSAAGLIVYFTLHLFGVYRFIGGDLSPPVKPDKEDLIDIGLFGLAIRLIYISPFMLSLSPVAAFITASCITISAHAFHNRDVARTQGVTPAMAGRAVKDGVDNKQRLSPWRWLWIIPAAAIGASIGKLIVERALIERGADEEITESAARTESGFDDSKITDVNAAIKLLDSFDEEAVKKAAGKIIDLAGRDPDKAIPALIKNIDIGYGEESARSILLRIGRPAIPYLARAMENRYGTRAPRIAYTLDKILADVDDPKELNLDMRSEILLLRGYVLTRDIGRELLKGRGWPAVPSLAKEIVESKESLDYGMIDEIAMILSEIVENGEPEGGEMPEPSVFIVLFSRLSFTAQNLADEMLIKYKDAIPRVFDSAVKAHDNNALRRVLDIIVRKDLPVSFEDLRMPFSVKDPYIQREIFELMGKRDIALTQEEWKFILDNLASGAVDNAVWLMQGRDVPIPLSLLGYKGRGDTAVRELSMAEIIGMLNERGPRFVSVFADALASKAASLLEDSPELAQETRHITIPLLHLVQRFPSIIADRLEAEKRISAAVRFLARARRECADRIIFGEETDVILAYGNGENPDSSVKFLEELGVKRDRVSVFRGTDDMDEMGKVKKSCLERLGEASISILPTTFWHKGHGNDECSAFLQRGPEDTYITYKEYADALIAPWVKNDKNEIGLDHLTFIFYGCNQYGLTERIISEIKGLAAKNGLTIRSLPVFITKSNKGARSHGFFGFVGITVPEKGAPLRFRNLFDSDSRTYWDDPAMFVPQRFDPGTRLELGIPPEEPSDFLEIGLGPEVPGATAPGTGANMAKETGAGDRLQGERGDTWPMEPAPVANLEPARAGASDEAIVREGAVRHKKRNVLTAEEKNYKNDLSTLLFRAIKARAPSSDSKTMREYSEIVANVLIRYDEDSLEDMAKRGILAYDEIPYIHARRIFDVTRLAKQVISILDSYKNAGITDIHQKRLLAHFYTVEEMESYKRKFPNISGHFITQACTNYPLRPMGSLARFVMAIDEIKKEDEFKNKDLPNSVIEVVCWGYPANPREVLRRAIKVRDEVMQKDEFKHLSPAFVISVCINNLGDPEPLIRETLSRVTGTRGELLESQPSPAGEAHQPAPPAPVAEPSQPAPPKPTAGPKTPTPPAEDAHKKEEPAPAQPPSPQPEPAPRILYGYAGRIGGHGPGAIAKIPPIKTPDGVTPGDYIKELDEVPGLKEAVGVVSEEDPVLWGKTRPLIYDEKTERYRFRWASGMGLPMQIHALDGNYEILIDEKYKAGAVREISSNGWRYPFILHMALSLDMTLRHIALADGNGEYDESRALAIEAAKILAARAWLGERGSYSELKDMLFGTKRREGLAGILDRVCLNGHPNRFTGFYRAMFPSGRRTKSRSASGPNSQPTESPKGRSESKPNGRPASFRLSDLQRMIRSANYYLRRVMPGLKNFRPSEEVLPIFMEINPVDGRRLAKDICDRVARLYPAYLAAEENCQLPVIRLTYPQELALFKAYKDYPSDKDVRNALAHCYARMVYKGANDAIKRNFHIYVHIEKKDVFQVMWFVFTDSLEAFEPEKGKRFSSYLTAAIDKSSTGRIFRSMERLSRDGAKVRGFAEGEKGESEDSWLSQAREPSPMENLFAFSNNDEAKRLLVCLDPRERLFVKLLHGIRFEGEPAESWVHEKIGDKFGLTRAAIGMVIMSAERKIKRWIAKNKFRQAKVPDLDDADIILALEVGLDPSSHLFPIYCGKGSAWVRQNGRGLRALLGEPEKEGSPGSESSQWRSFEEELKAYSARRERASRRHAGAKPRSFTKDEVEKYKNFRKLFGRLIEKDYSDEAERKDIIDRIVNRDRHGGTLRAPVILISEKVRDKGKGPRKRVARRVRLAYMNKGESDICARNAEFNDIVYIIPTIANGCLNIEVANESGNNRFSFYNSYWDENRNAGRGGMVDVPTEFAGFFLDSETLRPVPLRKMVRRAISCHNEDVAHYYISVLRLVIGQKEMLLRLSIDSKYAAEDKEGKIGRAFWLSAFRDEKGKGIAIHLRADGPAVGKAYYREGKLIAEPGPLLRSTANFTSTPDSGHNFVSKLRELSSVQGGEIITERIICFSKPYRLIYPFGVVRDRQSKDKPKYVSSRAVLNYAAGRKSVYVKFRPHDNSFEIYPSEACRFKDRIRFNKDILRKFYDPETLAMLDARGELKRRFLDLVSGNTPNPIVVTADKKGMICLSDDLDIKLGRTNRHKTYFVVFHRNGDNGSATISVYRVNKNSQKGEIPAHAVGQFRVRGFKHSPSLEDVKGFEPHRLVGTERLLAQERAYSLGYMIKPAALSPAEEAADPGHVRLGDQMSDGGLSNPAEAAPRIASAVAAVLPAFSGANMAKKASPKGPSSAPPDAAGPMVKKHAKTESEIIRQLFMVLDIKPDMLRWKELFSGFQAAAIECGELNQGYLREAFDIESDLSIKGTLFIIRYKDGLPLLLVFEDPSAGRRAIDLSGYYSDSAGINYSDQANTAKALFVPPGNTIYCNRDRYTCAVLDQNNSPYTIKSDYSLRASKYPKEFSVIKMPVLPGVYVGAHSSSLISVSGAAKFSRPGIRVLVLGTGIGLEAIIAARKGARVDALDIKDGALANTELTSEREKVSDRVRTLKSDIFASLGKDDKYDLIIFNMPHMCRPENDRGPEKYYPSNVDTADPGGKILKRLMKNLRGRLNEGGMAFLVNGDSQDVINMLCAAEGLSVGVESVGAIGHSCGYVIRRVEKIETPKAPAFATDEKRPDASAGRPAALPAPGTGTNMAKEPSPEGPSSAPGVGDDGKKPAGPGEEDERVSILSLVQAEDGTLDSTLMVRDTLKDLPEILYFLASGIYLTELAGLRVLPPKGNAPAMIEILKRGGGALGSVKWRFKKGVYSKLKREIRSRLGKSKSGFRVKYYECQLYLGISDKGAIEITGPALLNIGQDKSTALEQLIYGKTALHITEIGENLKTLRGYEGLTVNELAEKSGVDVSLIKRLEAGKGLKAIAPTRRASILSSLADNLRTTLSHLLTGLQYEDLMSLPVRPEYRKDDKRILGFKLMVSRYISGMTQKEVAKRVGISQGAIGEYESGKHMPRNMPVYIKKFAEALGTTASKLIAGMELSNLMSLTVKSGDVLAEKRLLGTKINVLRYERALTVAELAEGVGVSTQTILNWERGRWMPDEEHLIVLAEVLNVAPEMLKRPGISQRPFAAPPVPGTGAHMAKEGPASRPEGSADGDKAAGTRPDIASSHILHKGDKIEIGNVVIIVQSIGSVISRYTQETCCLSTFDVFVPAYRHLVREEVDDGKVTTGKDRDSLVRIYRYTDRDKSSKFRIDNIRVQLLPGPNKKSIELKITNPDNEPISVVKINKSDGSQGHPASAPESKPDLPPAPPAPGGGANMAKEPTPEPPGPVAQKSTVAGQDDTDAEYAAAALEGAQLFPSLGGKDSAITFGMYQGGGFRKRGLFIAAKSLIMPILDAEFFKALAAVYEITGHIKLFIEPRKGNMAFERVKNTLNCFVLYIPEKKLTPGWLEEITAIRDDIIAKSRAVKGTLRAPPDAAPGTGANMAKEGADILRKYQCFTEAEIADLESLKEKYLESGGAEFTDTEIYRLYVFLALTGMIGDDRFLTVISRVSAIRENIARQGAFSPFLGGMYIGQRIGAHDSLNPTEPYFPDIRKGDTVLDIGFAIGGEMVDLAKKNPGTKFIMANPEISFVRRAIEKAEAEDFRGGNLQIAPKIFQDLHLPSHSVRHIVARNIFFGLKDEDIKKIITEILRVAAPDATILICGYRHIEGDAMKRAAQRLGPTGDLALFRDAAGALGISYETDFPTPDPKKDVRIRLAGKAAPGTGTNMAKEGDRLQGERGDTWPIEPAPVAGVRGDIKRAEYIMEELMPAELKDGRVYEIRYDSNRLREYAMSAGIDSENSPEKILEEYVKYLQIRVKEESGKPEEIIDLKKFNGHTEEGECLISVTCYKDSSKREVVGKGRVNIKDLDKETTIRMIAMLNMAIAASHIPKDANLAEFSTLVTYIEDQYNQIAGEKLVPEKIFGVIELPKSKAVPANSLDEYYRLTMEELQHSV